MMMLAAVLMIMTIIGVGAFQGYWIRKLYVEEWSTLKRETEVAFRDVVYQVQMQRFRKNKHFLEEAGTHRAGASDDLFMYNVLDSFKTVIKDSLGKDTQPGPAGQIRRMSFSIRTDARNDTFHSEFPSPLSHDVVVNLPFIIRYLSGKDSTSPPLSVGEIDSAYKKTLLRAGITVAYRLERTAGKAAELEKPIPNDQLKTGFIYIGLSNAYAYQAIFANPFPYIVRKLRLPIIVGFLLLAFTALSLIFLYRNLVQQRQIAAIKNEFISNMTHELKTPIATVTVAVEALRHFGALDDPEKTREYLDISALEIQRLSLLVDKVLKLSLFENRQIELKPERIDVATLVAEVMASMKLSFEKAGASVRLSCEEDALFVRADRMHLASVISNLLDNALKYSRESPVLAIGVSREGDVVRLSVADNGIGIPAAYREKIFEKFFRVPSGDHHNIKGYGLGLSYVHHIVMRHEGTISVESKEGKGSLFTIQLPAA
jgi:two-component system phosphate regulon sensor histidine kinase PhoR